MPYIPLPYLWLYYVWLTSVRRSIRATSCHYKGSVPTPFSFLEVQFLLDQLGIIISIGASCTARTKYYQEPYNQQWRVQLICQIGHNKRAIYLLRLYIPLHHWIKAVSNSSSNMQSFANDLKKSFQNMSLNNYRRRFLLRYINIL